MARKFIDLTGLAYYDSKIKAHIDAKVEEVGGGFVFAVMESLPSTDSPLARKRVIYLVPNNTMGDNVCDEYILIVNGNNRTFELIGTTTINLSGKANKSEMGVAIGHDLQSGLDIATITLKTGTNVTALVQHQDISGKSAKAVPVAAGNLAALDAAGNATDSQKASSSLIQDGDLIGITENEIDGLFASGNE